MTGCAKESVEAVGVPWLEVEPINACLERLKAQRQSALAPTGYATRAKVAWKIEGLKQMVLYRSVALADSCAAMWNAKNPVAAVLSGRALTETVALLSDFLVQLERLCDSRDFNGIDDLVMSRTFGTKLKSWVEQGIGVVAVNALGLVTKLDKRIGGAGVFAHYETMCEFCHPNSLGLRVAFSDLDADTAILRFSDTKLATSRMLLHLIPSIGLIQLLENDLGAIDLLLPKVVELSEEMARMG